MDKFLFVAQQVNIPNIPKPALNGATVQNVLGAVFLVAGAVAVLFLIIGAIKYGASNGDQGAVSSAKNTILYAVVGLIVSLSAFAVVQFVLGQVG